MSVPMDPPYCLIYPTSYMRDVDPDHFDTHNNLAGTHLHHCICHTMLQFANDDPNQHRKYSGSQSAQTPLQPRSPPVPKSQTQTARRSLPGLTALASMAVPLPHLLSQSDANGKMFARKTPTPSTPPFPSVPACLMASTVQLTPTVM